MGGQIALSWAAAHPDEIQSLWLLDPAGIWSAPQSEVARTIREGGRNPLLVANMQDFDRLLSLTMSRPPPIPRFIRGVMAERRMKNRDLEERIFRQLIADSLEARVQGLRKSALVVFGAEDRVVDPRTAQVLHSLMPRSHVVIMPGVGHLPMLEEPAHTASDYVRFRDSM
jgi:pimeloyl-ACP methyl ester carboxylesterase